MGKDVFSEKGKYVLVSPTSVRVVAEKFPKEDARTFFSTATHALMARAERLGDGVSTNIVVPRTRMIEEPKLRYSWQNDGVGNLLSNASIDEFIRNNIEAIPIVGNPTGKVRYLEMVLDSYRTLIYELFLEGLNNDPEYALSSEAQRNKLSPALRALARHLKSHEFLSLSDLDIDAVDLGFVSETTRIEIQKIIASSNIPQIPIRFEQNDAMSGIFSELIGDSKQAVEERTRRDQIRDVSDRIYVELKLALESFLQVQSLDSLPDPDTWLKNLKDEKDTSSARTKILQKKLVELLKRFPGELYNKNLYEVARPDQFKDIIIYDVVRFYGYALDRAITRLPWAKVTDFLVKGIDRATSVMSLGQLQGVQHFFFNSKYSPVIPRTHELAIQMSESSPAVAEMKPEQEEKLHQRFKQDCEKMLK